MSGPREGIFGGCCGRRSLNMHEVLNGNIWQPLS